MPDKAGKRRALDVDSDSPEQDPLEPKAFIETQIQSLNSPFKPLDAQDYAFQGEDTIEQDVLNKAVKRISKRLVNQKERKLADFAVQAIVEQIEYLKATQGQAKKAIHTNSEGNLKVTKDDWLDDLPPHWPESADSAVQQDDQQTDKYSSLLAEVRDLSGKNAYMKQKTSYYGHLINLVEEDVDAQALRRILLQSKLVKRAKPGS